MTKAVTVQIVWLGDCNNLFRLQGKPQVAAAHYIGLEIECRAWGKQGSEHLRALAMERITQTVTSQVINVWQHARHARWYARHR